MKLTILLGALALMSLPSVALAEQPCRNTAGPQRSAEMVRECTDVSPATHPPCNAANACSLIIDEIKRGCGMLSGTDRPSFCDQYSSR